MNISKPGLAATQQSSHIWTALSTGACRCRSGLLDDGSRCEGEGTGDERRGAVYIGAAVAGGVGGEEEEEEEEGRLDWEGEGEEEGGGWRRGVSRGCGGDGAAALAADD